jgi:hypothetical protein
MTNQVDPLIPHAGNFERAGSRHSRHNGHRPVIAPRIASDAAAWPVEARVVAVVKTPAPVKSLVQERKKADPVVVQRRRESRKYKFINNDVRRSQSRTEEKQWQRSLEDAYRIAERAIEVERARYMFRRALRGKQIPADDIRDLPEYWLLRHFGYDVRAKEHVRFIRTDGTTTFLLPTETEIWKWWLGYDLSSLVRQMKDGKVIRICAWRKLIARDHPNQIPTTVADLMAVRKKYLKLINEENRVNPL